MRVSSSKRDRRKTDTSTFANFIHQKDAHIAMSLVEEVIKYDFPIYTVHDNFITISSYSHKLPEIYCNVFKNMGPPLSIINEFIYMNVIQPIEKREGYESNGNHFIMEIISKDALQSFLMALIPDNISKKQMSIWKERISSILTSYDKYTRIVCGKDYKSTKSGWISHHKKWTNFMSKLKRSNINSPIYCLHY